MTSNQPRAVRAGGLRLRISDRGETRTIQLEGELDLANADTLERELREALGEGSGRVVVDMGELQFIDSTGIALLLSALGSGESGERVRFVRSGSLAVRRVLELTGVDQRLPFIDNATI